MIEEEDLPVEISLAKKTSKKAKKSTVADSNSSYFAYGDLTLGAAAATCAYLYKRRNEKRFVNQSSESLDEGYTQVWLINTFDVMAKHKFRVY